MKAAGVPYSVGRHRRYSGCEFCPPNGDAVQKSLGMTPVSGSSRTPNAAAQPRPAAGVSSGS